MVKHRPWRPPWEWGSCHADVLTDQRCIQHSLRSAHRPGVYLLVYSPVRMKRTEIVGSAAGSSRGCSPILFANPFSSPADLLLNLWSWSAHSGAQTALHEHLAEDLSFRQRSLRLPWRFHHRSRLPHVFWQRWMFKKVLANVMCYFASFRNIWVGPVILSLRAKFERSASDAHETKLDQIWIQRYPEESRNNVRKNRRSRQCIVFKPGDMSLIRDKCCWYMQICYKKALATCLRMRGRVCEMICVWLFRSILKCCRPTAVPTPFPRLRSTQV